MDRESIDNEKYDKLQYMSTWLLINQTEIKSQPVSDLQTWAVQSEKVTNIMRQVRRLPHFFGLINQLSTNLCSTILNQLADLFTSLHLELWGL